jgi:undecaprenyl-diphosphatase
MDLNTRIFFTITNKVGKNRWLDAFGRAGAEWVIIGMLGWYTTSVFVAWLPHYTTIFWKLGILGGSIVVGWILNFLIGLVIWEPRPAQTFPNFSPALPKAIGKNSFPSDHVTSAFLIVFIGVVLGVPWSWNLVPLALWVAWGRVYMGVHYPIDTAAGVVVAGFIAMIVKLLPLPF